MCTWIFYCFLLQGWSGWKVSGAAFHFNARALLKLPHCERSKVMELLLTYFSTHNLGHCQLAVKLTRVKSDRTHNEFKLYLKTAATGTKPNKSKAPSAIKTDYALMKLIIFPFYPQAHIFSSQNSTRHSFHSTLSSARRCRKSYFFRSWNNKNLFAFNKLVTVKFHKQFREIFPYPRWILFLHHTTEFRF